MQKCGYVSPVVIGEMKILENFGNWIITRYARRNSVKNVTGSVSETLQNFLAFAISSYKAYDIFRKIRQDKFYMSLWYQDLKYFSACNFFNGRIPPNYETLSRF